MVNLFENKQLAEEHNPEFRLVPNNIDEVYKKVTSSHPTRQVSTSYARSFLLLPV
jgi:hypothetical protein